MKVDPARHKSRPWRVHSLAPDFELLDVWICRPAVYELA